MYVHSNSSFDTGDGSIFCCILLLSNKKTPIGLNRLICINATFCACSFSRSLRSSTQMSSLSMFANHPPPLPFLSPPAFPAAFAAFSAAAFSYNLFSSLCLLAQTPRR